jgi:hypothetical protein
MFSSCFVCDATPLSLSPFSFFSLCGPPRPDERFWRGVEEGFLEGPVVPRRLFDELFEERLRVDPTNMQMPVNGPFRFGRRGG